MIKEGSRNLGSLLHVTHFKYQPSYVQGSKGTCLSSTSPQTSKLCIKEVWKGTLVSPQIITFEKRKLLQ
jgi:hypothetical protein